MQVHGGAAGGLPMPHRCPCGRLRARMRGAAAAHGLRWTAYLLALYSCADNARYVNLREDSQLPAGWPARICVACRMCRMNNQLPRCQAQHLVALLAAGTAILDAKHE